VAPEGPVAFARSVWRRSLSLTSDLRPPTSHLALEVQDRQGAGVGADQEQLGVPGQRQHAVDRRGVGTAGRQRGDGPEARGRPGVPDLERGPRGRVHHE